MHAHNPFCLCRNCNTVITECNTAVENELLHKKSQCSATQNSSFTNLKVVYKNYIKHNKKTTAAGINNNVPPNLLNNSSMYTKTMQQKISTHTAYTQSIIENCWLHRVRHFWGKSTVGRSELSHCTWGNSPCFPVNTTVQPHSPRETCLQQWRGLDEVMETPCS